MIGKYKKEDIRKAYFAGKLDKLLAKAMEEKAIDLENSKDLTAYLETLRGEEKKVFQKLKPYIKKDDLYLPTLGAKIDQRKMKEWIKKVKVHVERTREILEMLRQKATAGKVGEDEKENLGLELVSMLIYLKDYRTFREIMYRRVVSEYMGYLSATAAKARAKATMEYQRFKQADSLVECAYEGALMVKKTVDKRY